MMIRHARPAGAKRRNTALTCHLFALSLLLSLPAAAAELRLLRARPARVSITALAPPANGAPADTLRLDVDAGGDRYELRLRPKTHLGALAARERSRATAYEGRLPDRPGSWVAVTRLGNRWSGIWFDGLHYYGIDSAAALAAISSEAAGAAADSSLVFRLSDVSLGSVDFGDDIRHAPQNAEQLVDLVSAELNAPTSQLATLVTRRLQVALIADAELYAKPGYGTQTGANMLTLLNAADGIFANQVGVQLQSAGAPTIFDGSTAQPFSTDVSKDLLEELLAYRTGSPQQRNAGLSHLITGRDLDGADTTVGIAYLGELCGNASASISQLVGSSTLSALIMVHEIGHVFGAPHDGDAAQACANTQPGYVMAPQLNINYTMFSDCSLQQMAPVLAAASCLTNVDAPDAAVEAPPIVVLPVNRATDATITVRSVGNVSVTGVNLRITLPQSLTLVSATGPTASCSNVNNIIDCALGSIAPNTASTVTIRVLAAAVGTSNVSLRLFADADGQNANNSTFMQLQALQGTDLAVTASADPAALLTGATSVATFVMENRGPAAPSDARLILTIPAGLSVLQQTAENTVCGTVTNGLSCGPSVLAVAGTVRVTLTLRGNVAGSQAIVAAASSSAPELQPADNTAQVILSVSSPQPPAPAPKGGGGRMPPELLAGLALLWLALHASRGAQARSK